MISSKKTKKSDCMSPSIERLLLSKGNMHLQEHVGGRGEGDGGKKTKEYTIEI